MATLIAMLALSYLLGSFPTAIVAGRLFFGRDPRLEGSGNAGATNVFRLFGWKAGVAVSLVDLAKGAAAVALVAPLASGAPLPPDASRLLAGLAAVAGHVWTVFAGFRGGKGIATSAGAILVLAPGAFLVALAAFALTLLSTGIVSLSSMAAAAGFSATVLGAAAAGRGVSPWLLGFALAAPPFVLFTHRKNLRNLAQGREKRFEKAALLRRLLARKPRPDARDPDRAADPPRGRDGQGAAGPGTTGPGASGS